MEPRITAFSNTAAPPLDSALQAALLQSARAMLDEVIRTGSTDANAQVPADLQALAGWGMFVTLTRAGQLRACRGRWGDQLTLPQLLATVVTDTALHDQRFAAITAAELPRLDLDISLMHSPAALEGIGHSLAQQVRVGTHGLVITHPRGRGLLLPQVAVEQGWDAPTFLHQLCRKANLPADTWVTDEATHVLSFQVELLQDAAPQPDLDFQQLHDLRLHQLLTLAEAVLADQATSPPDPADAFLNEPRPGEELGVQLHTGNGLNGTALGAGHSLAQLTRMAAQSLRDLVRQQRQTAPTLARLDVLGQSLRLRAADFPQRHNLLALQAVLAQHEQGWELSLPDPHAPHLHRVQMALQAADIDPQHWRQAEEQGMSKPRLTAFNLHQHQREQYPGALAERAPARAGQFYPGKPEEMQREVERWLTLAPDDGTADSAPAAHRAIMLPHAGWMYCGKTLGRTLRQTQVPDTVIIIGPKHTNQGCNWSVPPHQRWRLPTGSVPIAVDLLEQLLRAIPGLRCDAAAHAMEHGVEVLLPFLQHVNPQVRVAPMALGHCNYDDTQTIARGLRQVLDAEVAAGKPAPLLLISSDMNHFAPDAEGRRLDRLALDAMLAGDPRQLYDTCLRHEISMCGMRPAVAILNALRLEPEHPLHLRLTHYSTSADASGDRSRVVGYAGVLVD